MATWDAPLMTRNRRHAERRPACMRVLGLLPPYSVEDVKKAYREKAKSVHPDGGGDAEAFKALHEAYQHALDLASFRESRRHWMGQRVERYLQRLELIEQIQRCGGRCVLQHDHEYALGYGPDFAEILRELVTVHLTGPSVDDAALETLCNGGTAAREIRLLVLSGTRVTDEGLLHLADLELRGLDVSHTEISARGLEVLRSLSKLEWLHVGRTRLGLWGRRRLRCAYPRLTLVTGRHAMPPRFDSAAYQHAKIMQRLGARNGGLAARPQSLRRRPR